MGKYVQKKKLVKEKRKGQKREIGSLSAVAHRHIAVSSQASQHELPICQH